MTLVVVLLAWPLLSGCPTFEDSYTGTYRQVNAELASAEHDLDGDGDEEAVEIDFFRFGDRVAAILRVYEADTLADDPFGRESYCVWTSADDFDEANGEFHLRFPSSSRLKHNAIVGRVVDGQDRLDLELLSVQRPDDRLSLEAELVDDSPSDRCTTVADFAMQVSFPSQPDRSGQRLPQPDGQPVEHPLLVLVWQGVACETNPCIQIRDVVELAELDADILPVFDPVDQTLEDALPVRVPPPEERFQMPSGRTSFALGHLLVVEDADDDGLWDPSSEPVLAAGLQKVSEVEACEAGTDLYGPALLYVDGGFGELSAAMRATRLVGEERSQAGDDRHFFVVTACAEGNNVRSLHLTGQGLNTTAPLHVTEDYLVRPGPDSDYPAPLPRLLPL